jgi:hypothetical protein
MGQIANLITKLACQFERSREPFYMHFQIERNLERFKVLWETMNKHKLFFFVSGGYFLLGSLYLDFVLFDA